MKMLLLAPVLPNSQERYCVMDGEGGWACFAGIPTGTLIVKVTGAFAVGLLLVLGRNFYK